MIAAWMLYAAATALLLALAAAGADRLLRLAGRATRWPWAAAMAASIALPVGAWLAAWRAAAAPAEAAAPVPAAAAGGALSLDELLARATVVVEPASPLAALDAPLAALWIAGSLAVAAWVAAGALRLRRARREWRPAVVADVPVLVSGRTGPAVAGVVAPAVVLPEWALDAEPETLALMLAHEREHVRAADPALLAAAGAAVALMPWNPAAWWQLRRLRHAVEVDCDRRVLRRHPDLARYGALLLEVGRRGAALDDAALPLAALASTRSSLERRIRTMTMRRPRHPLLQGAALAGGAALLVLAACETPRPTEVAPAGEIPLASIRSPGAYATDAQTSIETVRAAIGQAMPPGARDERTGRPHEIWLVSDADGRVIRTEIMRRARSELRVGGSTAGSEAPAGPTPLRTRQREGARAEGRDLTAGIAPEAIASVEIMKLAPGRVTADSANVVLVRLKPGATLGAVTERPLARGATAGKGRRQALPRTSLRSLSDTAGPKPLVVVDGEERDQAALEKIDPKTIESVEVVKGEAARRLYGERGANGVIKVTLKK